VRMVISSSRLDPLTKFVNDHERRLRPSLSAACGDVAGSDAAADALAYGWEHWERIKDMENPIGYL
jgi:hypothetical protein